MRLATLALIAMLATSRHADAVILLILNDEFDDTGLVASVRETAEVKAMRKQMDEFEKPLLKLKERNLIALFGKPQMKPAKTYAMPVAEHRGMSLSGIRYADPALNKNHTDFYVIKDVGALEIYYAIDGISPVAILVYFAADKDFPPLGKDNLKQRLAWDETRLKKLFAHTDAKLIEVFPWEVDREELAKIRTGDFQTNAADKLKAWIASAPGLKETYQIKDGRNIWRWHDATGRLVREATGGENKEPPVLFTIYHPNGEMLRRDHFHYQTKELTSRAWGREKGSGAIRGESTYFWYWIGKDQKIIRMELDDNHDGIPDWYLTAEDNPTHPDAEENNAKKKPLAINDSWAINPKLIPEECQIPDQANFRVPVRKKVAATPGK